MKHLRRAGTTIVVALFSAGLVTVASAPAANADDDGAAASKTKTSYVVSTNRRDSSWG
ncbi:hypothetical protein [Nocardioides sp. CFH 31398]|uniref:hypothetical protein n=1 Tax=Nocardioides sp. CFH 31398 TaxID=2919579 RepID=UPI001F05C974|nr:hypothetical protein [Nocardioides sp. CFH 31398]MCH1865561.1 hypothetical protein [Nocardioides sp. CFH 31398]